MCVIAGYAGDRPAAPILLEMLRRQECYDGDMTTGVATIHEGKLYYRRCVGNVDTVIRSTDILSLPGTIGIAHSRPGAGRDGVAVHPFLSSDEATALVLNGTGMGVLPRKALHDAVLRELEELGYEFSTAQKSEHGWHRLSDGRCVMETEMRVFLIEEYMKRGKTPSEALALTSTRLYSDNATVILTEKAPDSIFALRTTRPLVFAAERGETWLATSRYGLPDALQEKADYLPLFHSCALRREGVTVTGDRVDEEPVAEPTPYTYAEGCRRIEAMLRSDEAPLYFDELELEIGRSMRDLFPGDHSCLQNARLVYDLLRQFEREGRLKKELRVQQRKQEDGSTAPRRRWYFWLED